QHGAYMLLLAHCWQNGAIPNSVVSQANIVHIGQRHWRRIRPPVVAMFRADGTHKRVTLELERTEKIRMQRRLAGARGGAASVIARARAASKWSNATRANGHENTVPNPSKRSTNQIRKKESESVGTYAREPHRTKAADRTRPDEMSRQDLETMY